MVRSATLGLSLLDGMEMLEKTSGRFEGAMPHHLRAM